VADVAMVDVLGMCIYASSLAIHKPYLYFINNVYECFSIGGYYIHIGVGFEVAYLNEVASSKARSVR